jgi:hypothetical protein
MKKLDAWDIDGGYVTIFKEGSARAAEEFLLEFEQIKAQLATATAALERIVTWDDSGQPLDARAIQWVAREALGKIK